MENLDFQDLPYEDTSKGKPSAPPQEHTVEFSDFPPDATEEQDEPTHQDQGASNKPAPSIFSLAYYQQFFDVDTGDVGRRLLGSMVPNPKRNYLEYVIRPKPDLYGPFWVCATLTFSIAITGNMADFFATSGQNFIWKYDFGLVSLAATVIFGYWLVIPLIIWGVLRWRGSLAGYILTEIVCVYGYSLAIFIPCSILWLIPSQPVQYLLVAVCSLLSGATIVITLYPAVKNDSKQVMAVFMLLIVALHALLATGFVMYFFHYTTTSADIHTRNSSMPTHTTVYSTLYTDKDTSSGKRSHKSYNNADVVTSSPKNLSSVKEVGESQGVIVGEIDSGKGDSRPEQQEDSPQQFSDPS
ncbi:protein YIPF1-like [Watersipora subatra]|uniref:protein YIPF1-like n=1 Tax=Watersipora subatra TaxID=2589382 RepID=UPI00355AF03F